MDIKDSTIMNNKGFTLIELLVGISISTILMISVGILVSGGIKNITSQQKNFKNSDDFTIFENKLNDIFSRIDTDFEPKITSSGIIVKINNNFDEGGFAYIGTTLSLIDSEGNGIYCLSGSEDTNTKHVFIKSFIPDFDIDIQKSHKIEGIGKNIFGYNEIPNNGLDKNKVYLNNPTGSGSNGSIKFISDTLNNRVLYKSGSKVYELLDENDGLEEPTGLYYDNSENALYISNSAKGEVLKLSSKKYNPNPTLTLTGITNQNINSFNLEFFNQNGKQTIKSPNLKSNFKFINYTIQDGDTVNITDGNKLNYSFSGGTNKNISGNIEISNIGNLFGTGTYYVKTSLNNKIYKYFIQGDDNLTTKDDNKLKIYKSGLEYPTKITGTSNSNITKYWNGSKSNMDYDKDYDYILKTPVKNLDISYDDINKLLNFKVTYYKKYNCYNLDDKIERTFILKKNFR